MSLFKTSRVIANCLLHSARRHLKLSNASINFSLLSSQTRDMDISGVFPPIATPFDTEENVAWDKLSQNIQKWNAIPFRGYVVLGSNGESAYLSTEERVEIVKFVAKNASSDKMIIAGSGCESTRSTIEMTEKMAKVGAKAALVITPCFYKGGMTNESLIQHFQKVADASPVPVILYSVPANTGIDLAAEVIIKLSTHPNIIGLKDSGGDISKLANLVFKTKKEGFQILAGSAGFLYPAYSVGCVGGICALGNILGEEVCKLEALFKAAKLDEAKNLQQRLVAPNSCVTRKYGVPGLKKAMDWFGYYGGPTRSPLQPLTKSEEDNMKTVFLASGFEF